MCDLIRHIIDSRAVEARFSLFFPWGVAVGVAHLTVVLAFRTCAVASRETSARRPASRVELLFLGAFFGKFAQ